MAPPEAFAPGVAFKEDDMDTLKLKNPIKINGKEVRELTYDVNEITADAFVEAEMRKFNAVSKKGVNAPAMEMDYSMHLELGFAAIVAVNPNIDYNDLGRLKGPDLIAVARVGRNFIMPSVEEEPMGNSTENKSESA